MRRLLLSLVILAPLQAAVFGWSQQSPSSLLQHAYVLRNDGDSRATITLLAPVLGKASQWPSELERGKAWNLLGAAYQDVGLFSAARRCHENAIVILRNEPDGKRELAAALDNLGSVENAIGAPETSRTLREAARRLYLELEDTAGLARTSNSLATIAIHQGDFRMAKKYEVLARDEGRRAQNLDEDDRAALESVTGTLAVHDGNSRDAIECFSKAIAFWKQKHGDKYWMVGLGYSLRAQAFGQLNDRSHAYSDMDNALKIAEDAVGKGTALYWRTELVHAELLTEFGDAIGGKKLKELSMTALAQIERDQCVGCVTSVAGLKTTR